MKFHIFSEDNSIKKISDEYMWDALSTTRDYSIVILKSTPRRYEAESENKDSIEKLIWEHGRRNFELRAAGLLSIVCPISDSSGVVGVGIYNAGIEEVKKIMDEDPGVKAGIFVYEVHPCRSFPSDSLPT